MAKQYPQYADQFNKNTYYIHDRRKGWYESFPTKQKALAFAYRVLKDNYGHKSGTNNFGTLVMMKDRRRANIGWYRGYPAYEYFNETTGISTVHRIYSDGTTMLI